MVTITFALLVVDFVSVCVLFVCFFIVLFTFGLDFLVVCDLFWWSVDIADLLLLDCYLSLLCTCFGFDFECLVWIVSYVCMFYLILVCVGCELVWLLNLFGCWLCIWFTVIWCLALLVWFCGELLVVDLECFILLLSYVFGVLRCYLVGVFVVGVCVGVCFCCTCLFWFCWIGLCLFGWLGELTCISCLCFVCRLFVVWLAFAVCWFVLFGWWFCWVVCCFVFCLLWVGFQFNSIVLFCLVYFWCYYYLALIVWWLV